jgi:hypothetical protein
VKINKSCLCPLRLRESLCLALSFPLLPAPSCPWGTKMSRSGPCTGGRPQCIHTAHSIRAAHAHTRQRCRRTRGAARAQAHALNSLLADPSKAGTPMPPSTQSHDRNPTSIFSLCFDNPLPRFSLVRSERSYGLRRPESGDTTLSSTTSRRRAARRS